MTYTTYAERRGFYCYQLIQNILTFWLPRCEDKIYGGYFNCFDNAGKKLISTDKYTWSQGRFMWIFARLSMMDDDTFSSTQRKEFLRLAEIGKTFLIKNVRLGEDDWRCVFLMNREGVPKKVDGYDCLDMSIYADCFIVLGMCEYAMASEDHEAYAFAKNLYVSIKKRVLSGNYNAFPYPLPTGYRAHGIPMILTNVCTELFHCAMHFDTDFYIEVQADINRLVTTTLNDFTNEKNILREVVKDDGTQADGLMGNHLNPGHIIENMWFIVEAAEILEREDWIAKAASITKRALELGWDYEQGGILHYCSVDGGKPLYDADDTNEIVCKQVKDGWGDKLWWVHSESLYSTILLHAHTQDASFLEWYNKIFEYTFRTFPNSDDEVREWIQIRERNGCPHEKVVALPVKDPYHIIRNFIMIIQLMDNQMQDNFD